MVDREVRLRVSWADVGKSINLTFATYSVKEPAYSDEFLHDLGVTYTVTSTPWKHNEAVLMLSRRDGKKTTPKEGGDVTLAARGVGLNVLRVG